MNVIPNINNTEWSDFIEDHPQGTIFQHPDMYLQFNKTSGYNPLILGIMDDRKLCGILLGTYITERSGLSRLLSTRFVIYGGPLLVGDESQQVTYLKALLDELILRTKNKALFVQIRNLFSQDFLIPLYEECGFSQLARLNNVIPISDRDTAFQKMSENRRKQIRKGLENGASIISPEGIDQVKDFYQILYKLYRNKIRKPLPDWSFFNNFFEESKQKKLGIIRLIIFNKKVIGGILAPVFGKECIYEWYVCGLDKDYKHQYPSVLATWAGIDYAIENGIKQFDFMGVGVPDKDYGVRDFKARFGGGVVNYGRLTRINNKPLYNVAELGYNILALLKKI